MLPRFFDLAKDVAHVSRMGLGHDVSILDFANAFMTIPLHPDEQPFNASIVPQGIRRSHPQLFENEPEPGSVQLCLVATPTPGLFSRGEFCNENSPGAAAAACQW